jgi:ubiquinone/menaquinone biosynthesis C-methylase UbiE
MRQELVRAAFALADGALRAGDVLDVGCGTGWWLECLHGRGIPLSRLHGIDALDTRVRAAAARVPGATVQSGDARSLPFEDDRFSAVTLFVVLSSLEDREAVADALGEAQRVTRPDGSILVWDVRYPNPLNAATRRVSTRDMRSLLGAPTESATLTLVPPLARRLGPNGYSRLAAIPMLRSHRLSVHRTSRPEAIEG